ncbi:MAG: hypothetical protein PHS18_04160 [Sphaerochaetaceae bacterium]|nr:hypothetical protein [Sphaerochaetaceae bacterium]
MVTKYEIIEPDHWRTIGTYQSLEEAQRECNRLNKQKRGHCIEKIENGRGYLRDSRYNYAWRPFFGPY